MCSSRVGKRGTGGGRRLRTDHHAGCRTVRTGETTEGDRLPVSQPATPRASDVARAAGVSAQTVSNVMNGRGRFSEDVRHRVLTAARELGYVPNRNARGLRLQRTRQLGIHMTSQDLDVRSPFHIALLRGLINAGEKADHQIVVFTRERDAPPAPSDFARRGMDGFVLFNSEPDDARPAILAELGIPFALMGRTAPELPQTWVDIDNAAAMAQMVDYLVGKGHESFAYIGYDADTYWLNERLAGTRERLREHGVRLREPDVLLGSFHDAKDAARRVLGRKRRPTAIIHTNDRLAISTHAIATGTGLLPGRDIAITGFDSIEPRHDLEPSLTSVRLPVAKAAAEIIRRLITEIEHGPTDGPGLIVSTAITIGDSA